MIDQIKDKIICYIKFKILKCQTKKVFELSQNKILPRDASFKDKQQKSPEKNCKIRQNFKKRVFCGVLKLSFT